MESGWTGKRVDMGVVRSLVGCKQWLGCAGTGNVVFYLATGSGIERCKLVNE